MPETGTSIYLTANNWIGLARFFFFFYSNDYEKENGVASNVFFFSFPGRDFWMNRCWAEKLYTLRCITGGGAFKCVDAPQCVWSDLFFTLEEDAFTDLTSSDERKREEIHSFPLSPYLVCLPCLLSLFDSIIFFSFFFLLYFSSFSRKKKPLGYGGSCFKCWPCPFFLGALFSLLGQMGRRWKLIRHGAFDFQELGKF